MLRRQGQRGDTLIEVLFAMSIFSLVVVGSVMLMNQGSAAAQRALETTLVRQQIDAQGQALRLMHDAYVAAYQSGASYDVATPAGQWVRMIDSVKATNAQAASDFGVSGACPGAPSGSFIIDTTNALFIAPSEGRLLTATTFGQITYEVLNNTTTLKAAEGLWIEAVRSGVSPDANQSNTGFIDFHIRACWDAPAQAVPMTIGTIVRLYEPRG